MTKEKAIKDYYNKWQDEEEIKKANSDDSIFLAGILGALLGFISIAIIEHFNLWYK
jgi:hypothetical protein